MSTTFVDLLGNIQQARCRIISAYEQRKEGELESEILAALVELNHAEREAKELAEKHEPARGAS